MFAILNKIKRLFEKKEQRKILLLFIMMVISAFFEMVGVSLMLPLISALMNPEVIQTKYYMQVICSLFGLQTQASFTLLCITALIGIYVIKNLFLWFQYRFQYKFLYESRYHVQRKLLRAYLEQPYEFYLKADTGEILRIIQRDVETTFTLFRILLTFFSEMIVAVVLLVTIMVISPMITLGSAVVLGILMLVIVKGIKPVLRREGIRNQEGTAKANQYLLQTIQGIKEIKIGKKELFFEELFAEQAEVVVEAGRKDSLLENMPRLLIETVSICTLLGLMAVMILLGEDVRNLVPVLSAFAMAAIKLIPSANRIVNAVNSISYLTPALDSVVEQMNMFTGTRDTELVIRDVEQPTVALKMILQLNNISYHYPDSEENILTDASMTIPVGSMVGVIGVSGAGKTTAINILLGLLKPQSGQVLVDGRNIAECYDSWVSTIGYIPQQVFLMDATILENVAFGEERSEVSEAAVWQALADAQMEEYVRHLSHGLYTRVGENGIRLSGGQRQRIGIARALYTNPNLLVFDEATSALDMETEHAIMDSIHALHGKKTMVIIAHRLTTIEQCDLVYRVESGKIHLEKENENNGRVYGK